MRVEWRGAVAESQERLTLTTDGTVRASPIIEAGEER